MTKDSLRRRLTPLAVGAMLTGLVAAPAVSQEAENGDRLVLDVGHTDAVEVSLADDDFVMSVKDDTFLHADEIVYRDPADVLFQVKPEALAEVPGGEQWEFLGEEGDPIYMLPQTQDADLLWPGWSTERMGANDIDGTVELAITSLDGPGELKVFMTGAIGGTNVLADTEAGFPQSWAVNVPAHVHANWVFTEPGTYQMTFEATAAGADGSDLSSGEIEYLWHVGDLADFEDPTEPGDPVETALSVEGLAHHYHTGDDISLTAVQDPQTDLDHYHWFTRTDTEDWDVVDGAGTDTLELTAGEAPALDGAEVIARLYDDDHDVVAESTPVTIDIDDHDDDHDHGDPEFPFADVSESNAHYDTVYELYLRQITVGTTTETYSPDDSVSRGQLSSFVARMLGLEDAPADYPDVATGHVHAGAIGAVTEAGLFEGFTNGEFGSADAVSREQIATVVARALELEGHEQDRFDDIGDSPHRELINALADAGVTFGVDEGSFEPDQNLRRDQMASFLIRAAEQLDD